MKRILIFIFIIFLCYKELNSQIFLRPINIGGLSSLLENGEILYDNKVGFSSSNFQVFGITYQRKIDSNWRVGIAFHVDFNTSTDYDEIRVLERTYQIESTDRYSLYNISLQLHRFLVKNKKNNIYIFTNLGYSIKNYYLNDTKSEIIDFNNKWEFANYKEFNTGIGTGMSYQVLKNVSLDFEVGIAYNYKKGFDDSNLNNLKFDTNKVQFGTGVGLYFCF
jgi:hypothetical protein